MSQKITEKSQKTPSARKTGGKRLKGSHRLRLKMSAQPMVRPLAGGVALSSARRKRHKEAAKEPSWFLCDLPRTATSLFPCENKMFCVNGGFGCDNSLSFQLHEYCICIRAMRFMPLQTFRQKGEAETPAPAAHSKSTQRRYPASGKKAPLPLPRCRTSQ